MSGSTKIEREAYEQYRIDRARINTLLNQRNPMGGRRDIYEATIDDIIAKYGLPR